jgi:hypothetical protein
MLSPFVGQKLGAFICSENAEDLIVLTELIESGQVTPVIDRTYPLSQTPAAIRYLQEGHAQGKVVIKVTIGRRISGPNTASRSLASVCSPTVEGRSWLPAAPRSPPRPRPLTAPAERPLPGPIRRRVTGVSSCSDSR